MEPGSVTRRACRSGKSGVSPNQAEDKIQTGVELDGIGVPEKVGLDAAEELRAGGRTMMYELVDHPAAKQTVVPRDLDEVRHQHPLSGEDEPGAQDGGADGLCAGMGPESRVGKLDDVGHGAVPECRVPHGGQQRR